MKLILENPNSFKLVAISTTDVDNFKKLNEAWVSKVDLLDDVFEASTDCRIVIHKDQQDEFTKFLGETGFEHKVLVENLETYVDFCFLILPLGVCRILIEYSPKFRIALFQCH